MKSVAVKVPSAELNVRLVPLLGAKPPVAPVTNNGKQVVSELSSATVTLVAVVAVVADVALPLKSPLNVVAETVPVTDTPEEVVSNFLELS